MSGTGASVEAPARADRSRDIGNHLRFCRRRQVERLIEATESPVALGTVH